MEKVLKFLNDNTPFYCSTVSGDRPRCRPLGLAVMVGGKIYFGLGKHKEVYAQLKSNPNLEICATAANGTWIRISGRAVLDDNAEAKAAAFKALPMLNDIYNDKTGYELGMLCLSDMIAEFKDPSGKTVDMATS